MGFEFKIRPHDAGQPQLQQASATRTPATVVTVSDYAHIKTHRPAIKTMLSEMIAQPWEMAENATYAITLHGEEEEDTDAAESASSNQAVEAPVAVARVQGSVQQSHL